MKKGIILFCMFCIGLVSISGCSGSSDSSSSSLSGSLAGSVALYLSDATPTTPSGVTVSIQGTSFSTTTDSSGHWTISGLNQGTYTVIYTKPGYGMSEQQGVQFVGGGTDFLGTVYMSQPPPCGISLNPFSTVADSIGFQVGFTMSNFSPDCGAIALIAVGENSNVSAGDPAKYLYTFTTDYSSPAYLYKSDLYAAGFKSGTMAYIVAYTLCQYNEDINGGEYYSSYLDDTTGRTVYTSLGSPSNVIPLTVP
jgi:Carboxypeptidase regulatory-like domain